MVLSITMLDKEFNLTSVIRLDTIKWSQVESL